jgi:circadian clock protein KaiC
MAKKPKRKSAPSDRVKIKKTEQKPTLSDRVKTGVPGLDEMVGGGLERNNSIIVKGASGVGKTILALQYLWYGATKYNEPGIYLSFAESREAIFKRGMLFGWDFEKLEKEKKFVFARYEPHEIKDIVSSGGGSVKDMIESTGTERLVIDSLSAYFLLFDTEYEADRSVLELFEMLHGLNCTTLVTSEDPITPSSAPQGRMGFLTDGIIHLYNLRRGNRRTRAIEIVKMRNTNHTTELCSFDITKKGIAIRRGFCWRKEDDYGDVHQSKF